MQPSFTGFMGECVLDKSKTIDDFKSNPEMWYAIECNGKRYKYTEHEMNGLWVCILLDRERLAKLEYVPTNPELDVDFNCEIE